MQTDLDTQLRALADAVPTAPTGADERVLAGVLARWPGDHRRRVRFAGPRMLFAAALVVLAGGSLAYAVGGRVVDAVRGAPAPPKVQKQLASMGRLNIPTDGAPAWVVKSMTSIGRTLTGRSQRVLLTTTPSGRRVAIYTAPTTKGGYCVIAAWGSQDAGSCVGSAAITGPRPFDSLGVQGSGTRALVTAHTHLTEASSVRIRFAQGDSHTLALHRGWFAYELPAAHQRSGSDPLAALELLNGNGKAVRTVNNPFGYRTRRPVLTKPVASSIHTLASAALPNGGGTVVISRGVDATGNPCFRVLRDGKSQRFPLWRCTPEVNRYGYSLPTKAHPNGGQHVPVDWETGLRTNPHHGTEYGWAYAYGWTAPNVATLRLHFQGGGAIDIPLHEHDYLYAIPESHWAAGTRPSTLEAYDLAGTLLYRQFLYPRQHCIYPGHDAACLRTHYGMATG